MRDHNDNATACADARYCFGQSVITIGVEIGIRLVKDDQKRFAIERTSESYSLALTRRESRSGFADPRLVSFREVKNKLVYAGRLCCKDYCLRIWRRFEATDILGDRAVKQLNILWQIADVTAECIG